MRGNTGKVQRMRVKDPLGGDFPRERAHARGCFPSLSMDGAEQMQKMMVAQRGPWLLRIADYLPQHELTDLRCGGKYLCCQFAR
jgi:hypothetical protein